LRDLIAGIDGNAPALPRISQAIAEGLKNAEAMAAVEAKRLQETVLIAEQAVTQSQQPLEPVTELASKPTTPVTAMPVVASATTPDPIKPAITQATAATPVAATATRNIATGANVSKKKELIAIRTPDPSFPSDAFNRGISGSVDIEFVVMANGEVSEVRVLNSSQRAFDRNVITTVKRWKFAPMDEPMTVRRSFNFTNPS
jgi:periplasmic protein TonB